MARISRTVRLYSMHGRDSSGPIDYPELFEYLQELDRTSRVVSLPNDLGVAVESVRREGDLFMLRLLVGNREEVPLFFDESTGRVTARRMRPNQWLASATHAVVDTCGTARTVALELRRNGIGAATLERVLENLGNDRYAKLRIELAPLAAESFLEEIERFERIREATLVVAQPNFDWNDHNDRLHELADESGAARAESTVTAGRDQSLNRDHGLVGYIKALTKKTVPDVKNAIVRGTRPGETQEASISLQRHILSGRVEFDSSLRLEEQNTAIWEQSAALIRGLSPRAAESEDDESS